MSWTTNEFTTVGSKEVGKLEKKAKKPKLGRTRLGGGG
jgi:hypothetical protein